jgi:CSLREA domain-containing protein
MRNRRFASEEAGNNGEFQMKWNPFYSLLVSLSLLLAFSGSGAGQSGRRSQGSGGGNSPSTIPIFNVTTNVDSIDGSCSPTTCSLRDAITAANGTSGAIINVPDNTYALTHGVLNINSSMTISGTSMANTIVDGGRSDRIFSVNTGVVTISGMTIQHGYSPGVGGGIADSSNLTLNTVKLFDNHAGNSGGGIVDWTNGVTGTLALDNSTVISNTAGFGGGISGYNTPNWLRITNSTIISNVASTGAGIDSVGPLTITQSTISNNISTGAAGGIRALDGGAMITSTVSGNKSHNVGAGLYLSGPSISTPVTYTVRASAITNNVELYSSGGGINIEATNVTVVLINTTVSGNKATLSGGGLYDAFGQLELFNTTVSNNTAANGGGVFILANINTATHTQNSLIAGNSASTSGPDCLGILNSQGYNLVQNTTGCTFAATTGDITKVNPRLGPLQNNGGATVTQALLVNSPAINAGNPAGCKDNNSVTLTTDQRGMPRPFDGSRCDIGSFEFQSAFTNALYLPLIEK